MKILMLLLVTSAMIEGCFQNAYTPNTERFRGLYSEFLAEDEKEIETGYIYMRGVKTNGQYTYRTFYPDTRTLTLYQECDSKACNTLNGDYRKWNENGNRAVEGRYKDGEKQGVWTYYNRKTDKMTKQGSFQNGNESGLWKMYDDQGRLNSEAVYEEGEKNGPFVQFDSLGTKISRGEYKADTIFSIEYLVDYLPEQTKENESKAVQKMPMFDFCAEVDGYEEKEKCAQGKMLKYIYKTLKYPLVARENDVQGMAIVQFVVDKTGKVTEIDVIRGICDEIKAEVTRVVEGMPQWIPGEQNGEKVRVLYTLPIRFNLGV